MTAHVSIHRILLDGFDYGSFERAEFEAAFDARLAEALAVERPTASPRSSRSTDRANASPIDVGPRVDAAELGSRVAMSVEKAIKLR